MHFHLTLVPRHWKRDAICFGNRVRQNLAGGGKRYWIILGCYDYRGEGDGFEMDAFIKVNHSQHSPS